MLWYLEKQLSLIGVINNDLANPRKVHPIPEPATQNDSEIQNINEINIKVEESVRKNNLFNCNCKQEDKLIATHYCNDCEEGFCQFCVKVHLRIKALQMHDLLQINYYCKCQKEEKILASKYCEECSEAICSNCIIAHERFTRNHTLKSI